MQASARRVILLHYHLFKNAGTSVDAMLRANFAGRWANHEFEAAPRATNSDAVRDFLIAGPGLAALSSHTALMPVPVIEGVEVFPIMFVRHPVLRIRSAYTFERGQGVDSGGARLARQTDFAGYLRTLLDHRRPNQAQNFQTGRLAWFDPDATRAPLARARRALDALPFVGLVEQYDRSIARLAMQLRPSLPDFEPLIARKNVTGAEARSIGRQLAAIRDEIGEDLYGELLAANADDLAIHREVSARYTKRRKGRKADARARA